MHLMQSFEKADHNYAKTYSMNGVSFRVILLSPHGIAIFCAAEMNAHFFMLYCFVESVTKSFNQLSNADACL